MSCLWVCVKQGCLQRPCRWNGAGAPTCAGRASVPLEWPGPSVSCSLSARSPPAPNSLGSTWDGGKVLSKAQRGWCGVQVQVSQVAKGSGIKGQGPLGACFLSGRKRRAKVELSDPCVFPRRKEAGLSAGTPRVSKHPGDPGKPSS